MPLGLWVNRLCYLFTSNLLILSDFVLMGYFKCWRGGFNRTWHSLFPAICELEKTLFQFHSLLLTRILGAIVCFFLHDKFSTGYVLLGVQGQECGCSTCEKSWKGWIQSYSPYCWYPKTGTQRGWYQEQVKTLQPCYITFSMDSMISFSSSFSFTGSYLVIKNYLYKLSLTDLSCHHFWHWRTLKGWTLERWTK